MGEFHQHPDGHVYVRGESATYMDSRKNFEADFGATLPELPPGADDHIYTQGKRHAYMGGGDIIDGGPMPWPEGDKIIARVSEGITAQMDRIERNKTKLTA